MALSTPAENGQRVNGLPAIAELMLNLSIAFYYVALRRFYNFSTWQIFKSIFLCSWGIVWHLNVNMVEHDLVKYEISETMPPACLLMEGNRYMTSLYLVSRELADGYQRTKLSEGSVSHIKTCTVRLGLKSAERKVIFF